MSDMPTPADSPADPSLDEILERIENYYTMKYGMDYEENEKPMSKDEAKAALSLWKQRAVVAELESLKKSWTYGADGFARTDAYEQLNDRIQQLTVQPDKHGLSATSVDAQAQGHEAITGDEEAR